MKVNTEHISNDLAFHIKENILLHESIFRIGSEKYYNLLNEARDLFNKGLLTDLNPDDQFLLERLQTGTKAKYRDRDSKTWKTVTLDDPWRLRGNKNHKFGVYIDTGRENEEGEKIAKFLGFGDPNADVANWDEGRRKSFLARHKCDKKKDKTKPGFWSCNVHLFHKQLGLKSDKPW